MKMVENEKSNLNFDRAAGFSVTKSSLPSKIIQLRKMSQENHVRRMKLAYQKKEMQGLMDISSCLSTSFPRRNVSHSESFVTIPKNVQSCTGNIQSRRKEKFDLFPVKTNSDFTSKTTCPDSSKRNLVRKSLNVIKFKNSVRSNNKKTSVNISKDVVCNRVLKKKSSGIEKNDCPGIKLHSTKNSKDEKLSSNNETKERDHELVIKQSLVANKQKENIANEKKSQNLVSRKKPSKIPILKTRLKMQDNLKETYSNRRKICKKSTDKPLPSLLKDVLPSVIVDEEKQEKTHVKETYNDPIISDQGCKDDSYENVYKIFCEEEDSRKEAPLIDNWMNDVLDTVDTGEISNESPVSKLKNMTLALQIQDINALQNPRKPESTSEILDFTEGSEVFYYKANSSESEGSLELYYKIEETDNTRSKSEIDNFNNWKNTNFEADSTITVPSDKDLELADHRDPVYKDLADYPNTPYNLRYLRYKFKSYNNILSLMKTESTDGADKIKTPRNRRKSYNATPKRIKYGRKRKPKKQIIRKKETY